MQLQQLVKQFLSLVQSGQYQTALTLALHPAIVRLNQPQVMQARGMTLLHTGQEHKARDVFMDLLTVLPQHDAIHNVVADLSAKLGEYERAEHHFKRATSLKPTIHQYWFNWGLSDSRQERHTDAANKFVQCLAIDGQFDKARIELAKAYIGLRSYTDAERELSLLLTKYEQQSDWRWHLMLAQCLEARHQYPAAEAQYLLGLKRTDSENVLYEGLALLSLKQNDTDKAISWLTQGLAHLPADRLLLKLVTRLTHESYPAGAGSTVDPLAHYKAIDKSALTKGVKLDYVNHLVANEQLDEAKNLISELKSSPSDMLFKGLECGIAIKEKDFDTAITISSSHLIANDNHFDVFAEYAILAHFAQGNYELAGKLIDTLLNRHPKNQYYWGLKSTELKLTDPVAYEQLMNFQVLLNYGEISISNDYCSVADFNEQLLNALKTLHTTVNSPLEQSGRGGTQTPGFLFDHDIKVIQDLRLFLTQTATDQLAKLKSLTQPTFAVPNPFENALEIVTAWSMWLKDGGFHRAHCHPKGWFSSAYYVQTPGAICDGSIAGNITFGRPGFDTYDKLDFDRKIVPKPGHLALFPSFYWHGTEPFSDDTARVTVAFDMLTK